MTPPFSEDEWTVAMRQQAAVARLGQLGLQGVTPSVLVTETLAEVADTLGVRSVVLLELDAVAGQFRPRGAIFGGRLVADDILKDVRIPAGLASMPGFAVRQGEATVSSDIPNDIRFSSHAHNFDMDPRAAVIAPVGSGDRPWGVLAAYDNNHRNWKPDDIHFVQSMANTLGMAISRNRTEQILEDTRASLDLSMGVGGLGTWTWHLADGRVDLNESGLEICGLPVDFDGDAGQFLAMIFEEDQFSLRSDAFEAVQTTGDFHMDYRIRRGDDSAVRCIEIWGRVLESVDKPERLVGVIGDVTERRQADEIKEALLLAEHKARVEAERARERLAVLAEVSGLLSGSLDPLVVTDLLARSFVPRMADVCIVSLVNDAGTLVDAKTAAVDDETMSAITELRRRRTALGDVGGLWNEPAMVRPGARTLLESVSDADLQRVAADAEHLDAYRQFAPRSAIVVPMVARHRTVGVLTLIATRPQHRYDQDLLGLVEDLANRAALALDNAQLFSSLNAVARSLQAALLPPALPVIDGLELGARYRVAEGDIAVGGDFYDIIECGERHWAVVVGDVCGRGPDAAAITGLMRHSVRAAVVRETLPSRVLAQTNDAVLGQIESSRFCTAAYLSIDLGASTGEPARILASSAGHPCPIIVRADGSTEAIACSGMLLGVVPALTLVDVEATLSPGDAVVLFTDGVTEARHDGEQFGEERLHAVLATLAGRSAADIAIGVEEAVIAYSPRASDDVAVLVARVPAFDG
ncbi:MAG: SpoIIE family protein phosphatase [Aquihabitans sp.]